MVFLYALMLAAILWGAVVIGSTVFGIASRPKTDDVEIAAMRSREQIATKGLRAIANGDALPITTAEGYLQEIEATYSKRKAIR